MIITTTPNIEKYQISRYLGVVTGADTYTVGGLLGEGLAMQNVYFNQAVSKALSRLENTAISIGADAVVGLTVSNTSAGGEIIVTLTGTAVKIEQAGWDDELPDI